MGRIGQDVGNDAPPVTVKTNGFYMQKTEITKLQWDEVRAWAVNKGYSDLAIGAGKAADHPVYNLTWWDAIKWCNARSEKEGLIPCYTIAGEVMRAGRIVPEVNWLTVSYRLPTEAEWEKASRGGIDAKRFPWGAHFIDHLKANYYSDPFYDYDTSGTQGYIPGFSMSNMPFTSPVGTFEANGYGLFDMAGNVMEWCWDYYGGAFYGTVSVNPVGPTIGSNRVLRGGAWAFPAELARCSHRYEGMPGITGNNIGFRVVSPAQGADDKKQIESANVPVSTIESPLVENGKISDITASGANLTFFIKNDGGAAINETGIIYSLSNFNANPLIGGAGVNRVVISLSDGELSVKLTKLMVSADYTFKAYAINNAGVGYANLSTFRTLNALPYFNIEPSVSASTNPGERISFSVRYQEGLEPFQYRWRKNGTIVTGASGSSYTIASAKQNDEGIYDCVITNLFGSFTTQATLLTVTDPVVIVASPLSRAANLDEEVFFSVKVTGTEPIEYQWRKNGEELPGENAPSLTFITDANSGGFYDVVVTNPLGSVTSAAAALTVLVPPVITVQPSDQNVSAGATAFFSVTASGPGLSYQWRRNGADLSKQNGSMLMVSNVQKVNEGVYDVLVKNAFGAVLSDPAVLSLPQPLGISEHPQDVTSVPGDTATFSVTAVGQGTLTYQWNKDGKPIKDARSSTLNVSVADSSAAGAYTVTVGSGSLKVTSFPAFLRVSEEGLLIYKFTLTGNSFEGTTSSKITLSGLLILDRLNQRGGIIRFGKNGKLDTFVTKVDDGIRTDSTGPVTNSQTVVSKVVKAEETPEQETTMMWLRGTDGLVAFSSTDKTMAPKTLAGFQTEVSLAGYTEVTSLTLAATLDNAASLQARQAGETVEQTLNRLAAGLQQKGFIRE